MNCAESKQNIPIVITFADLSFQMKSSSAEKMLRQSVCGV